LLGIDDGNDDGSGSVRDDSKGTPIRRIAIVFNSLARRRAVGCARVGDDGEHLGFTDRALCYP